MVREELRWWMKKGFKVKEVCFFETLKKERVVFDVGHAVAALFFEAAIPGHLKQGFLPNS